MHKTSYKIFLCTLLCLSSLSGIGQQFDLATYDPSEHLLKLTVRQLEENQSRLAAPLREGDIKRLNHFASTHDDTTAFAAKLGLALLHHGHCGVKKNPNLAMSFLHNAFRHTSNSNSSLHIYAPILLTLIGKLYMQHGSNTFPGNTSNRYGFSSFALAKFEMEKANRIFERTPEQQSHFATLYATLQHMMLSIIEKRCMSWSQILNNNEALLKDPQHAYKALMTGLFCNQPRMLMYALRHGEQEGALRLGMLTFNADVIWLIELYKTLQTYLENNQNDTDLAQTLATKFNIEKRIYGDQALCVSDEAGNITYNPNIEITYNLHDTLAQLAQVVQITPSHFTNTRHTIQEIAAALPLLVLQNIEKAKQYFQKTIDMQQPPYVLENTDYANDDPSIEAAITRYTASNAQLWTNLSIHYLQKLTVLEYALTIPQLELVDRLHELYDTYLSRKGAQEWGAQGQKRYSEALKDIINGCQLMHPSRNDNA